MYMNPDYNVKDLGQLLNILTNKERLIKVNSEFLLVFNKICLQENLA